LNFAKAIEKFGKILGIEVVTRGEPNIWKERCQNYEQWVSNANYNPKSFTTFPSEFKKLLNL